MLPKEKVIYGEKKNVFSDRKEESEEMALPELEGIDWRYEQLYCRDIEILQDTINHFYTSLKSEAVQLKNFLEIIRKPEEQNHGGNGWQMHF